MTARIAPLSPPYAGEVAEELTKLMPPGVEPIALFRTLAKSPRLLRRLRRSSPLGASALSVRERELVILRTTALCGAEYEWGVHAAFFAAAAGLSAEHLYATCWTGADAACFDAKEKLLMRLCDELDASARVSDRLWAELGSFYREEQLLELLTLAGQYRGLSYVINGARVALEPTAPRFPKRV